MASDDKTAAIKEARIKAREIGTDTAVACLLVALKEACDAVGELQYQVKLLQERPPFTYDGPHEAGKTYERGTFVTLGGSLWHCNRRSDSRPGDGPAWTLAVKAGRDAR